MPMRKSKRGGARPGAGRPRGTATSTPRTQIAVSQDKAELLADYARSAEITLREAADRAIGALVTRP